MNGVAGGLNRLGLTPNMLTVIGFVLVCIVALVIAAGYEALGGLLLIFSAAFDATDGALARLTNRATKFGAFLDSSLDRWADGVILLAIVYRGAVLGDMYIVVLGVCALIGSFLTSYTRARAESIGLQMKEGWFSRFERMVVIVLGLVSTAWFGTTGLVIALAVLALLSNITAIQRVVGVRRLLREEK